MKFTYNIQKVDFFSDQVEEMGEVNLENAIEVFQNFPFKEQLRQASEIEETVCFPTISFISPDNKELGIWAEDDNGFFLHYQNGTKISDFYLSNNFEKKPEGFAVEEFIELFFNNCIEDSLKLTSRKNTVSIKEYYEKSNSKNQFYSFKNTNKLKFYLKTIPFLIMALFGLYYVRDLSLNLVFSFFWLPGTIVHISYWIKNKNAVVNINPEEKTISYEKNDTIIKFNRNEIAKCELNETRSGWAPWESYSYLWIILKDHRQIVITNFIVEPIEIINELNLKYSTDRRTIPFLPL